MSGSSFDAANESDTPPLTYAAAAAAQEYVEDGEDGEDGEHHLHQQQSESVIAGGKPPVAAVSSSTSLSGLAAASSSSSSSSNEAPPPTRGLFGSMFGSLFGSGGAAASNSESVSGTAAAAPPSRPSTISSSSMDMDSRGGEGSGNQYGGEDSYDHGHGHVAAAAAGHSYDDSDDAGISSASSIVPGRRRRRLNCAASGGEFSSSEHPHRLLNGGGGGGRNNMAEEEEETDLDMDMDMDGMQITEQPPSRSRLAAAGNNNCDENGCKLAQLEVDVDIETLTNVELKARVKRWFLFFNPVNSGAECDNLELSCTIIRDVFGRKNRRPDMMHEQFTAIVRGYISMRSLLVKRGALNESDVSEGNLNEDFICIARNVRNAYDMVLRAEQIGLSNDPRSRSILPGDKTLFSYFTPLDVENEPPYRKLLRFLLNRCEHQQFTKRMDHDHLYAPYITPVDPVTGEGGYFTHSYKQVTTFERFACQSVSPKEQYSEQWGWLYHARRNRVHVAEDLKAAVDWQLPYIQKDRHMLAFRNGMYVTYSNEFYRWNNEDEMRILNKLCFGASSSGTSTKETRRCAAKYHNLIFDNEGMDKAMTDTHWYYSLETPVFQKMLDFQGLSKEVCTWVYVMFGRLLYFVGEKDNWQVQLFIKGIAGSGKSTMLRHFMRIFEKEDIGIMGNNVEVNFSLEALQECFAWFALDIKENFRLDQTTWQSMVSGEEVSIAMKHKTALMKQWNAPGMLASNVQPDWKDNSSSIKRRVMNLNMPRMVKNVDPTIYDELMKEMPMFIKKNNIAYLSAVKNYAGKNIWDVLPEYFHEQSRRFQQEVNVLSAYVLASGKVKVRPDGYIKLADFEKGFQKYCRHKRPHDIVPHLTEDYRTAVFQQHDFTVEVDTVHYEDCDDSMEPSSSTWIMGICTADVAANLDDAAKNASNQAAYGG